MDTKELTVVKQQVSKIIKSAESCVVTNEVEYKEASELFNLIKKIGKSVKARKEAITKPINESLKSVRELFKPIEVNCSTAQDIVDKKIGVYENAQEEKRRIEKERIANRVEKGTMKVETAVEKMDNITEAPRSVAGVMSTRMIRKVRITDESKLPREYLLPNLVLINNLVLQQGRDIPGTEVYEEKSRI